MNELERQLLQAVARKAGFDISHCREDGWIECISSMHAKRIWLNRSLSIPDEICFAIEQTMPISLRGMVKPAFLSLLPVGAKDAFCIPERDLLGVLRSLWDGYSCDLPISGALQEADGLAINRRNLELFNRRGLESERDAMTRERTCQDLFRNGLIEFYHSRCVMSGIDMPELLVASHIKPWASCQSDEERMDVFNGLLLAVHWDKLFDLGYISFNDKGDILISEHLNQCVRDVYGVDESIHIMLFEHHCRYMAYHREKVFLK